MSRENKVRVSGKLMMAPVTDHETSNGWMWRTEIATVRTSGVADMLQVIIPEWVMEAAGVDFDKLPRVEITGEIRRHRLQELRPDGQARWVPAVYAQQIKPADDGAPDVDQVELLCEINKALGQRATPLGKRITEMRVTMLRAYGHWDSVIVISWAGLADRLKKLPVGTKLHIKGRLQSRGYIKVQEDGTRRAMMTYEVSAYYAEVVKSRGGGTSDCM